MKIAGSFTMMACFFIFLSLSVPVAAANATNLPAWAVEKRSPAAYLSVPAFDKLHADLQQAGFVRVIVRFRTTDDLPLGFQAEGKLPGAKELEKQRKVIEKSQSVLEGRLSAKGKTKTKKYGHIPFMALEVDAADFQTLLDSSEVDLIEEDIPVPPALSESVPLIGADGSGTFSGHTGAGQTVAILDTGVATSHPVFSGKIVSEACYSTAVSGQSTSVCPSGQNSQIGAGSAINCNLSIGGCFHGTHVASIAAGSTGVAKNASIIAIQVFANFSNTALSWSSDQILALERVYSLRSTYSIASVNMSLGGGGPYSSNCDATNVAFKAAVDNLRSVGIATIIATGNSSFTTGISAPACVSTAISVGATTKQDAVASYSNSSSLVKLLAPGSSITAAYPDTTYASLNGTSMATPHVAGAWAVMKSRKPTATVDEVLTALTSTGIPIADGRNGVIKPRIQLDTAVTQIAVEPRIQFTSASYSVNENGGTATITVRRDISSSGAVSVDWATANGTATAGVDYTAASGTISFADGESGDKSFTVSIIDDALGEAAETINLTLSNLTGGAVPGAQNTAVLTINQDIGDLVNDGNPDIYLFSPSTGQTAVWYMNASTRLTYASLPKAPAGWNLIAVKDFNNDGNPDLIWFNPATAQIAVWYMNGTTMTSSALLPNAPAGWVVSAVVDYDKDGNLDIILTNPSTGQAAVWYMNASIRLGYASLPKAPAGWNLIAVKDFNNDGNFDLIWFNPTSAQIAVWYMNGTTMTSSALLPNAPAGWVVSFVVDYDKDGNLDIILTNPSTGQAAVWYMNASIRLSYASLPKAPSGWNLIAVKDFNIDGNLDLIWFSPASAQTAVWYMSGTTLTSSALLSNAPVGWKVFAIE